MDWKLLLFLSHACLALEKGGVTRKVWRGERERETKGRGEGEAMKKHKKGGRHLRRNHAFGICWVNMYMYMMIKMKIIK